MVLESTIICVDNSEYMRNGDFVPTRLQAEQDAVNLICHAKHKANAENNFGLLSFSEHKVLVTLTNEVGKILTAMHGVQPIGNINFLTGIRVAQLALKHRQTKNHKQRLVLFVGSPVENSEKELITVAKRLKKENVCVDVISFGEESVNTEKLTSFVNTVNGKGGSNSHLVTISSGPYLSEALRSSPVISAEEGGVAMGGSSGGGYDGFQFGVDPNEDPELALALRVSLEEQRQRSEKESKEEVKPMEQGEVGHVAPVAGAAVKDEEESFQKALALSMETDRVGEPERVAVETRREMVVADGPDEDDDDDDDEEEEEEEEEDEEMEMDEEAQLALAVQMSMETEGGDQVTMQPAPQKEAEGDEDLGDVIDDPEFLQSVLSNLPGVDTNSEEVRRVIEDTKKRKEEKEKKETDEK